MPRLKKIRACLILLVAAGLWETPSLQLAARPTPNSSAGQTAGSHRKWEPALLYGILTSPDPLAGHLLYRATFAAGPAVVPQLEAALKDDRTASFAARSLAYVGGRQAFSILAKLVNDPRNLDLRRFYYGALGEENDPRATAILLDKINNSDHEPDRSVTQDALLALTVRSNAALAAHLRQLSQDVTDPVIQDDIQNAADIIEGRARYLAQHPKLPTGGSVAQAIHTYFLPALEGPPNSTSIQTHTAVPAVKERIVSQTFSPNQRRALVHVVFETPQALANYEIVVRKVGGAWKVASVWLGSEARRALSARRPLSAQP
jgi:hypothetical protein